jgi:transaldolase
MSPTRLDQLSALGQGVWIDALSRDSVRGGELERLIAEDAVVGATSNPTIFDKAMTSGDAYDRQLRELLAAGASSEQAFWEMAQQDIEDACDKFRPVWEATHGRDGYVSLEVDPDLAYDSVLTLNEALRLHRDVDRPNLMVKIPATKPGLAAIEDAIAEGRSINVTLIFSLDRYEQVAESYMRGLERLVGDGGDASRVASVASFFVSRIDTEADRRLEEIGGHDDLKGRLAISNAKLAYQRYQEIFSGPRWRSLAGERATPQRLLWASTSTKNPRYPDTMYVDELVGPDTVNTMPEETIRAFQDHGSPEARLESGLDAARELLDELAAGGVDYADVTDTLEREGVEKFAASFHHLLESLYNKAKSMTPA